MTDSFETILDESISALQAGVPVEEILAEVPEYAGQLRPMLYAATILADPNPALVPEERKTALRSEYMKQLAELPRLPLPTFGETMQAGVRVAQRRLTRESLLKDLITIIITFVLTLVMVALTINYLSLDTIPGDFLYGVKRISESIQLSAAFSAAGRAALEEKFNQRRLVELEQLLEQNKAAVIQFRGKLETKGEDLWIVEKHTILLPGDVEIDANIQEGDVIEVIGLLRTNNVLVADTIRRVR
jgi:hypothetical protein